jgi:hypothetical protein
MGLYIPDGSSLALLVNVRFDFLGIRFFIVTFEYPAKVLPSYGEDLYLCL